MSSFNPLSWFGGGRAFADTIDPSMDRAQVRFLIPPDSRLYINQWSRRALAQKAEWLWQNFGIVKEGIGGISRHVAGKGISLQIDSEDSKWNELAENDFESYAMTPERCDLSGRRNFFEAQTTALEHRIIRGEFFAALAENPEWDNEPCFQIYDSEEVGSLLPSAVAEGKIILDGVEINQNSRAVAYHVRDANGNMTAIPRARMIHFFKPHAINQVRGITELAQAVNPLVDIYELKRIATRSAKAQLLLALFLKGCTKKKAKGAFGAIRNAGVMDDGVTVNPESQQAEQLIGGMQGGGIFYGESDNSDAKLLTSNSPSPLVEAFITDLLMRDVFAGFGLPAEFFWNPSKLNGGNTRFILARADLFFQIMGDRLIDRFCTPIAYRYLAHRIQSGKLANPKDPNWALKISWQMPPRVNIDNGREQAILIELLENGMITMREYCNARGQNYKAVMRQWIREPIEFARIAEEEGASPEYLARLKDNLPLWRAPKPGTITANTAPDHPVTAVDENGDPLKAAA